MPAVDQLMSLNGMLAAPHARRDEASLKRERPTLGCRERAPRGLKAHAPLAYAGMPELQGPGELVCPEHFPHDHKKSTCVDGMIAEPNQFECERSVQIRTQFRNAKKGPMQSERRRNDLTALIKFLHPLERELCLPIR